jgi:hypothetical protein
VALICKLSFGGGRTLDTKNKHTFPASFINSRATNLENIRQNFGEYENMYTYLSSMVQTRNHPSRKKWLAFWLLIWNAIAETVAFFLYVSSPTIIGTLLDSWLGSVCARANSLVGKLSVGLDCHVDLDIYVALVGKERTIQHAFTIMMLAALGAIRAVAVGVQKGTIIQAP